MPPNSTTTQRAATRAGAMAAAACAAFWAAAAVAHPIAIVRGIAVITDSHVTVALQEAGESLIHELPSAHVEGDITPAALEAAFARRAGQMPRRLELRDTAGRLLRARLVESSLNGPAAAPGARAAWRGVRAAYTLEYEADAPLAHITLRQSPDAEALLPAQFALVVRAGGTYGGSKCDDGESASGLPGRVERFVRLTSGGNAETLDVAALREKPAGMADAAILLNATALQPLPPMPASMHRRRFKSVQATVRREAGRVVVDVFIPLTLLETWTPISRRDADFVSPGEQRQACAAAARLLARSLSLAPPDSLDAATWPHAAPVVECAAVIGPGEPPSCDAAADARPAVAARSYWSSRVAVRASIATPAAADAISLTWKLFNPAVLTVDTLVIDGTASSEQQVSTYQPSVALPPPIPANAAGSVSNLPNAPAIEHRPDRAGRR
jgi:hypothetical protein